jgi:hypothetical protein
MNKQLFFAAVGGGSAIDGGCLARRYRHDLNAARGRLAAVDRTALLTAFGAVEYAERGEGEPLLAIHGVFGGCDAGLSSLRGLFLTAGSSLPRGSAISARACRLVPCQRIRPTRSPRCSTGSGSARPT